MSGLFELYMRGGCLNHEAKSSGLIKSVPQGYNRINHDKAIKYKLVACIKYTTFCTLHGVTSQLRYNCPDLTI